MKCNDSITIRVPEKLKEEMIEIAKANKDAYTAVIRKFCEEYVAKKGNINL